MLLIADTTVISNFTLAKRLDLLLNVKGVSTTEQVLGELEVGVRRGVLEMDLSDLRIEILKLDGT